MGSAIRSAEVIALAKGPKKNIVSLENWRFFDQKWAFAKLQQTDNQTRKKIVDI